MNATRSELETHIIRFLRERTGARKTEITGSTELFRDLGVDGDDARELLGAFEQEFRVNMSGCKFDSFFGPEAGTTPITLIKSMTSSRRDRTLLRPITVDNLIEAAEAGEWLIK